MSLTPDKTRTEHGLTIHEKIMPWGAVWARTVYGAGGGIRFAKGSKYKADRLLFCSYRANFSQFVCKATLYAYLEK